MKSATRVQIVDETVFLFVFMLFGKTWIHLFPPEQLWVNSWADEGLFSLVRQPVLEKEKSGLKRAILRLKTDLVPYSVLDEGVVYIPKKLLNSTQGTFKHCAMHLCLLLVIFWFGFVWFHGISTIAGYLIHFYKYKQFYFKQFGLAEVQFFVVVFFTHS